MVDLMKRVEETLSKDITVFIEHPDIEGFLVEMSYIGREEMAKLYERYTTKKYNKKSRRMEDILNRDKLIEVWADRAIKSWKGLTLSKAASLIPIQLGPDDNPDAEIVCDHTNRVALLRHNADFEIWVVDSTTEAEPFAEQLGRVKKEAENLKQ